MSWPRSSWGKIPKCCSTASLAYSTTLPVSVNTAASCMARKIASNSARERSRLERDNASETLISSARRRADT